MILSVNSSIIDDKLIEGIYRFSKVRFGELVCYEKNAQIESLILVSFVYIICIFL